MAKREAADPWRVPSQHQKAYSQERVDSFLDHPPEKWMKIMAVDPGTHRSGLLCAAVPGPAVGEDLERYRPQKIKIYAEAMLYNADAARMASEAKKLMGDWLFELIIIDKKGSDPKPGGFTTTIREQYETEFRRAGIYTRQGGYSFALGTPDTTARELRLKEWMRGDDPILDIDPRCHNLITQMQNFFRSKTDHTKREDNKKKPLEATHCLEYIAGHFDGYLYYHPPQPAPKDQETSAGMVERLIQLGERTGWQPFDPKRKDAVDPREFFDLGK